jgi:hypothetical protein
LHINFPKAISVKEITDYDEVLFEEEAQGILAYIVEGAKEHLIELKEHGNFRLSAEQIQRIEQFLTESEALRFFVEEEIERKDGSDLESFDIAEAFIIFCNEREWTALTIRQIEGRLRDLMLEIHHSAYASKTRRAGDKKDEKERGGRGYKERGFQAEARRWRKERPRRRRKGPRRRRKGLPAGRRGSFQIRRRGSAVLKKMNSIEERIPRWLDAIPGAISGSGGHNQTFRVACQLFNGWALSESETVRWLERYNERCRPPWSSAELKHKASHAAKAKHSKPRGYLAKASASPKKFVPIQNPAEEQCRGCRAYSDILPYATQAENNERIISPRACVTSRKSSATSATFTGFSTQNEDKTAKRTATSATNAENTLSRQEGENLEKNRDIRDSSKTAPNRQEPETSKRTATSATTGLSPDQLTEARRIAGELVKLHKRGAVKDATDPEACFCATLLQTFGGTVVDAGDKPTEPPTKLTNEQKVRIPAGLRGRALADYLQRDLEDAIGAEYLEG